MGSNNIIVREYLESLKEDQELDYLFPILLNTMGYRIIATPKEAKGQSQYGKDIIATGKDEDGIMHRYYFELKGNADKDITDKNYFATDGVRESIIEAKDTAFNDSSISKFNQLPIKIVFVHNGILKTNIRPTFEGFISREFKEGEFERWDIFRLTDLFSNFLFNEYLLTDDESLRLFKRTLVMLDAPENNYDDFKRLVDLQIEKIRLITKGRAFNKFFATQNLLCNVVLHYSIENDNLEPAKQCLSYLLLKTWNWVLIEKLNTRSAVLREFRKLVDIHYKMLDKYFKKTFPIAVQRNGLFAENGGPFEEAGYPLRCFDYLNYLVYYCQVRLYFPDFNGKISSHSNRITRKQKDKIIELINNNEGCTQALMDYDSITVLNIILYFLKTGDLIESDLFFLGEYLLQIIDNIFIVKKMRDRFPLLGGNTLHLVKTMATRNKEKYEDRSSLLIPILFELVAVLNATEPYDRYSSLMKGEINLQTAYPNVLDNLEEKLFEKHFNEEFYVETNIILPKTLKEFQSFISAKKLNIIVFKTDKVGFPFLRTLAHIYFKNEFFPEEWRIHLPKDENINPSSSSIINEELGSEELLNSELV